MEKERNDLSMFKYQSNNIYFKIIYLITTFIIFRYLGTEMESLKDNMKEMVNFKLSKIILDISPYPLQWFYPIYISSQMTKFNIDEFEQSKNFDSFVSNEEFDNWENKISKIQSKIQDFEGIICLY